MTSDPSSDLALMAQQLQDLLDREAIRGVLMDYCHGVDRCDFDVLRATYWPDAYDDHGNWDGGVEDLIARLEASDITASMHHLGNIRIELDGDTAWVQSSFVAHSTHLIDGVDHDSARGGRYLDRFERRNGRWAIAERKVADDWAHMAEVTARPPIGRHAGRRSPQSDPWYDFRDDRD